MTAEPMPISVAVVGAGTISQSIHLASLRRAGFDVRVVCDLSPSRAAAVAASVGAQAMTDPDEVFASDVDAVLIATPGTHARLAAAAIAHGKHVLAEKPVAHTMREIDELEQSARDAGVVVQVGYMKMFDPLIPVASRELAQLNGIRLVRVTVMHPADGPQIGHLRMSPPVADADPETIAAAAEDDVARAREALPGASEDLVRYYANVLCGSVIHELSLLRALALPLPDVWDARVITPLDGPAPATLLAQGVVDETAYVLNWNWLPEYPEYDEELAILASNGRMSFHLAKPYLLEERSRLVSRRHIGDLRADTEYRDGHETGFLRQLDAFAESICSGAAGSATLAGAREDLLHLQRIAASLGRARGERVTTEVRSPAH